MVTKGEKKSFVFPLHDLVNHVSSHLNRKTGEEGLGGTNRYNVHREIIPDDTVYIILYSSVEWQNPDHTRRYCVHNTVFLC